MNIKPKEQQNPIIEAYNLLCKSMYITSAVAVIEEAFSTMMLSRDSEIQELAGLSDDQTENVGREYRELLMELIGDPDGNILPEAIRQFNDDLTGFRKNARYRALERFTSFHGDVDVKEQGDQ